MPSIGKQSRYSVLERTVLHATARSEPRGCPVALRADAIIEQFRWYAMCWKIGVSREGHVFKSVKVRPKSKDSDLVAWEAP